VRLLLDTHIALWAITNSPRLPARARELIEDPQNEVAVSSASVWEITLKFGVNRENMPVSGTEALHWFQVSGFEVVGISGQHAAAVGALANLHADPFDRLIVAQALHEPYRLVTHDRQVAAYDPGILLF
jgi:PIN domain nuclease of toxin-antitoxin system